EQNLLPRHAFSIVGSAGLQRMICVVPNGDVLTEDFLADSARKARTLIQNRRARKVVKKEAHQVENGRRRKDCRVTAGRGFARLAGIRRLAAGAFGEGV